MGQRPTADPLPGVAGSGRRRHPNLAREPILTRIGNYEVEAEVGNGVRVKAFRAFDPQTDRRVALKFLMDIADAALTERFHREVALAAKIASPAFATLYEVGEHVGFPFAAMQNPGDEDFRGVLERASSLGGYRKVSVLWGIAEGARAAHSAGVPYLGLRPSAIALGSGGRPVIQHFGVLRPYPDESAETAAYAAPEEVERESPDALCDIFAFGRLCFELLKGGNPQLSLTESGAGPEHADALTKMLGRALATERALRYRSFEEIQEDLEPVLGELRRSKAAELLDGARAAVETGHYEQAQTTVREALEIDPHNGEADRLRVEIRGLLKHQVDKPRIETILIAAEEAREAQDYDRANEFASSALVLGVSDPELVSRIEASRRRIADSREALRLSGESRRLLSQGRWEEAKATASRAAAIDPGCGPAAEALAEIDAALRLRERARLVEDGLAGAKSLLLCERFDEAIATLRDLRDACPGHPGVEEWIQRVSEQKAASEKKAQIESHVSEVRALLSSGAFDMAIGALDALSERFPDAEISDLLAQAREAKAREGLVSQALEESAWLLEQGRPDLALQFLRGKASGAKADARFAARLLQVEAALREWERRTSIEECLRQVAALEQMKQWSVALTVLEEALSANPESDELRAASERVRTRAAEMERQRKLSRRLEAIRQKMAAQDWPQALAMIGSALSEFPGEHELGALESASRTALADATAGGIASEVRQAIADGESEKAGQLLKEGLEKLPGHPLLLSLEQTAQEDKRFRSDWRTAQVLFGRRQFEQAEAILARLAAGDRPEVLALLELVREGRAATEEAGFYSSGVDKATKLLQEKQFGQAADLLRNLLALFPADAILERHLDSAIRSGKQAADRQTPLLNSAVQTIAEPEEPEAPPEIAPLVFQSSIASGLARSKTRISWMVSAAFGILLILFAGISWRGSDGAPQAKTPKATQMRNAPAPAPAQAATAATAPPEPDATAAEPNEPGAPDPAESRPKAQPQKSRAPASAPVAKPVRPFNVASLNRPDAKSATLLAAPAGATARPDTKSAGGVLAALDRSDPLPAPPGGMPPSGTTAPQSDFRPASVLTRVTPELSPSLRQFGLQGTVELQAAIDKLGAVKDVKVLSGDPRLAAVAKQALLKWRYRPATLNGQPVEMGLTVHFSFDGKK